MGEGLNSINNCSAGAETKTGGDGYSDCDWCHCGPALEEVAEAGCGDGDGGGDDCGGDCGHECPVNGLLSLDYPGQ